MLNNLFDLFAPSGFARRKLYLAMAKIKIIKKKIKNIYIRVDKNGEPYITMPKYANEKEALKFFEENIERVERLVKNSKRFSLPDFLSIGEISIFGKKKRVRVVKEAKSFIEETADEFCVYSLNGTADEVRKLTEKYLKDKLSQVLDEYLIKWEHLMGLKAKGYSVRKTHSRWGSCNCVSGKLNFSLFLANAPIKCVSYVVLHEVCHLRYADHGVGFKRMLDNFMPEWRKIRKELNEVYSAMRFE